MSVSLLAAQGQGFAFAPYSSFGAYRPPLFCGDGLWGEAAGLVCLDVLIFHFFCGELLMCRPCLCWQ